MRVSEVVSTLDYDNLGREMYALAGDLYPICRSITGNGVRRTLDLLESVVPLSKHQVPSGTGAFDWTVPKEWNIRDAYVKNSRGEKVVDFQRSNLSVMSYSVAVNRRMSLDELRPHLFSIPEHPDWIPYRTSYYKEFWGFCLPHRQLEALEPGEYEVVIDSSLENGFLTWGEYAIQGASAEEVLISSHICHPSLCNDNLSGMLVAACLAGRLRSLDLRYSYRFLFIPGTIGSIVWLSRNEPFVHSIRHGLVLTCIGDRGPFTYKKSRHGNADIDRAAAHVLSQSDFAGNVTDFVPWGYDERQYCSPGFDLPVGCLMRTPHGTFPEYHTSADNLDLIGAESLAGSLAACLAIVEILEENATYLNRAPHCEPQLGKRGLYRAAGGDGISRENLATLWVLNQSDGRNSLLDIAQRSGMPFRMILRSAEALRKAGLIEPQSSSHLIGSRLATQTA